METVRICPQCRKPLAAGAPQGLCPACLLQAGLPSGATTTPGSSQAGAPAGSAPTPADLAPHFPQLEILELLGAGGMGMVYKARQPQLDRFVALKILAPEIAARDPAFADRFLREARALARLNHPNIVAVYDFGITSPPRTADPGPQAPGFYYFLMEYMDGANLRELITSQQLSPRQALAIVPKICDALQFAHDEGVMHRDIKPENILLDRRGRVKIADFGLAKILGTAQPGSTALTRSGVVMGTPRYMAPEQIEKPQTVDHRADIYSLGVVFYEMLTGELPLGRFEPPSHKAGVDVRLDEVVLRSLEKKPERRYQKASEVKTDVESIAGSIPPRPDAPAAAAFSAEVRLVRDQVSSAATALFILGALNCLLLVLMGAALVAATVFRWSFGPGFMQIAPVTIGSLFSPILMLAARKMRRLESREFVIFASVLAMVPITSPLFLVGIPIGIWCIKTLKMPEVEAAFRQVAAGGSAPAAAPAVASAVPAAEPARTRFSRKAIAGAVWAMFAALALPSWIVARPVLDVRRPGPAPAPVMQLASRAPELTTHLLLAQVTPTPSTWGDKSRPSVAFYLGMVFIVLGLTSPVGTTVLGLMAVHDIRHSNGRITGLPLALGDALLFPLLALGGVLYWLCLLANRVALEIAPRSALFREEALVLPAGILLWLGVATPLVILAWRAAKKPVARGV